MRAELASQQLTAVVGVETPAATGVKQVIGTRHAQQEMAREAYALKGYGQTPGQFQGEDGKCQRLATSALQHLVHHRGMRAQRVIFILLEAQGIELAQQWLCQFAQRQHRQIGAYLTLQVMQLGKAGRGLDASVVLGSNP